MIKRMATAMLTGAPHLGPRCWALADRYAVYVMDFLPQQTRGDHCLYYLRTGRNVNWSLVFIKVFGAPLLFSPPEGPIHKRGPIAEKGWFVGIQYPAVLVVRFRDLKIINVAKQKVRVHESCYTRPLICEPSADEAIVEVNKAQDESKNESSEVESNHQSSNEISNVEAKELDQERIPTDRNMVQSIKTLRDHRLKPIGTSHAKATDL